MKDMLCKDCHWFNEVNMLRPCGNGKIYPCTNIGVDGWECWAKKQTPPRECPEYCLKGTYKPEGIWAGVAKVVEEVAKRIKEDENGQEKLDELIKQHTREEKQ